MNVCSVAACLIEAKFQCSKCKSVRYCCREHQLLDWSSHKVKCQSLLETVVPEINRTTTISTQSSSTTTEKTTITEDVEQRICRCMFCGDHLNLKSEDEAIDHMRVCPALQEQLESKDQFTIPAAIRNKMPDKSK